MNWDREYISHPLDVLDRRTEPAEHTQPPKPIKTDWQWVERCLPYVPNAEDTLHWFIPYARCE